MASELVVVVTGTPAPQGSKRHVGGGRMVEQSPNLAPWRAVVTQAAVAARYRTPDWQPEKTTPMHLVAVFTLARPASHWRTGRNAHLLRDSAPADPIARPDLDKLLRSTMDALADAGALVDDSRVVNAQVVKVYPGGHLDALDTPGAVILLRAC